MFSPLTQQLIQALRALPGIGPKSAQRIACYLLNDSKRNKGITLAETLQLAMQKVKECQRCNIFSEQDHCSICLNLKREQTLLCVVETPADVIAVEQTSSYNGLYFILHGHLSPLDGIGPNDIAIPKLLERIQKDGIKEVILATNPTMEGKATAHYIASHLDSTKVKSSRIAHGVPLGGELEYLDGGTLAHALHSRQPMENLN